MSIRTESKIFKIEYAYRIHETTRPSQPRALTAVRPLGAIYLALPNCIAARTLPYQRLEGI
jgi:hypothetical protein